MEETLQKLLTVEEVMQILRISRPTLYRMLRTAKLQPVKIGKRTLFEMTDIRALIERSKGAPSLIAEDVKPDRVHERKERLSPKRRVLTRVMSEEPEQVKAQRENVDAVQKENEVPVKSAEEKKPVKKIETEDEKQGRLL